MNRGVSSFASRLLGSILLASVAASFIGCPLLKKKAAEDDATVDAATVAVEGTGAKNEATVLRYANETLIANEPAVIGKDGATARNFPGNGPVVATLAKGTPVAKISTYFSTGVLIMFDDPSGDGSKLIGWVTPKVFDTAAPAPTRTVVVPPRVVVDAGAKTTVADAGSTGAKDAGGAAPTPDAGGGKAPTIPPPPKGAVAVPPIDGKCYEGWTVTEGMCRRKCAADKDCPRTTKCLSKQGSMVCASS
jgi:hypothetical protein